MYINIYIYVWWRTGGKGIDEKQRLIYLWSLRTDHLITRSRDHEVPTKPDFKFSLSPLLPSRRHGVTHVQHHPTTTTAQLPVTNESERRCVNTSQTRPPPLLRAQTNDEGEDRERRDATTKTGTNDAKCVVWAIGAYLFLFFNTS